METVGTTSQGQTEQSEVAPPPVASNSASTNTVAGEATGKWTLPESVAKALDTDDGDASHSQHPGRIGSVQNLRHLLMFFQGSLGPFALPLVVLSEESRQVKLSGVYSLLRRGHADGMSAADFTRYMLVRFKERELEIKRRYSPEVMQRFQNLPEMLAEAMLIDAAFILEQLLQHWEAGAWSGTARRPRLYRYDLVSSFNQIPYMLLQDLIQMVKLGPLPDKCGGSRDQFLMRIAIGYIVAEEASEWLLTKYTGPVHHLLHLVHLQLASAVEQRPPLPPPSRSRWARCKAQGRRAFWEAVRSAKQALRRAADPRLLETAWWSYSMIPAAWDLVRVGIRLRPKKGTSCLADVSFWDGVLELPPLEMMGFDGRLLINLVALELESGSSQRLFLSYAVFMSKLVSSERDLDLLQSAGVLVLQKSKDNTAAGLPEWWFFRLLADLNSGRELHDHSVRLAGEVNTSYDQLNRAAACSTSSCLS